MKVWINADGDNDQKKMEIVQKLNERGWEIYVGKTNPNAHYLDYFNVTEDFPYYMIVCNGFCAGSIREAYSSEIQKLLNDKHVQLVVIFDTVEWTEGMKPYRYGDFHGYRAARAWDDNFSKTDPCIPDVEAFMKEHNAFYCAGPTTDIIMEQFDAGGCLKWLKKNTHCC